CCERVKQGKYATNDRDHAKGDPKPTIFHSFSYSELNVNAAARVFGFRAAGTNCRSSNLF
ncbi:hypothetical protein, partial [Ochrobactrum sp. SFR4]|uniref:hypothetical protein n=1 Tax=Ochrobactrum sp. SFR4 TaxID=2717368 RepID=UPI001C8CB771